MISHGVLCIYAADACVCYLFVYRSAALSAVPRDEYDGFVDSVQWRNLLLALLQQTRRQADEGLPGTVCGPK